MKYEKVTVVGLGYVGLALAVELSHKYKTKGLDINEKRVEKIRSGIDPNGEVESERLRGCSLSVTSDPSVICESDVVIITVPTPIDRHRKPDLTPLIKASETAGKHLKHGTIVVYESTVYPGATEEECVPVIERASGLEWKKDFFVAYSPERINPGDKKHTLKTITKVVAGDTEDTLERVSGVYESVVEAGVYKAPSIKVAEAAKVIENTQRDINIALMNELRIIFDKLNISTKEVLKAAGTKWNFLPFTPGLVGGHCIGVDPYYLAFKAEEIGHHPQIIRAGRRINDAMGRYFAREVIKDMIDSKLQVKEADVLVCGIAFKENVPDIRNARVIDVIKELRDFGVETHVWDPVADPEEVEEEYGISIMRDKPENRDYSAVILAVPHQEFLDLKTEGFNTLLNKDGVFFDLKEIM
ncbi:MAG: nucleotide sugar dehydrogenase [Chitinivibrionales bacterium]